MGDSSIGSIGIDPGISGAIAFLFAGQVQVFDTPVLTVPVGLRNRSEIFEPEAVKLIRRIISTSGAPRWAAAIEWAQAGVLRPNSKAEPCPTCGFTPGFERAGAVSAFSYGMGFGVWRGILSTLEIPYSKLRPQHWKKIMLAGYSEKNKDAARAVASHLFPDADLGRRKSQGRSEALLIAECGRRLFAGQAR